MLERMKKLISLAIAMLIVMATVAVPVVTADTVTPVSAQSTCTTCSVQTAGSGCGCSGGCGSNITAVQLNGSEASKAIADALKNDKVKDIRNELIARGYTPKTNDAIAVYKLADETTSINETTVVAIPFKVHDGSQDEVLAVYRRTGESVFVKAMMKKDQITTVLQDGVTYKYGYGNVFIKPMEILVANETYQNLKADLAVQGFVMNEANSSVVIDESSNIATISIIAEGQNSSKITYATVDLNTEIVTSITDPDWWVCLQ